MKNMIGILTLCVITVAASVAEDIVIDSFNRDGGITWHGAQVGSTCRIEWVSSLVGPNATNWLVLTNIPVASPTVTSSVPIGPMGSTFYRIAGTPAGGAVPTNGLVAYYPFNGNADDFSGMDNHGTLHGPTPTADRHGTPSSAYYFNGASYVDVTNDSSLNITNAITVTAWVNAAAVAEPGYVVAKGDYQTYAISIPEWPHFPHPDKDFVTLLAGEHLNAACPLATWTHIVFTYDTQAGQVYQYVDGVLRAQHAYAAPIQTNDEDLQIGRRLPNNYHFNGSIDELRIYNRALSSNEVWVVYSCLQ